MACHHDPSDMLRYEIYGEEDGDIPPPLARLLSLAERGKLQDTLYRPSRGDPWERLKALEADMIRASTRYNDECQGWTIARGECALDDTVTAWLEYQGWAVLAPVYDDEEPADFLVISEDDFVRVFAPTVYARVPLGETSSINMTRALRRLCSIEEAAELEALLQL